MALIEYRAWSLTNVRVDSHSSNVDVTHKKRQQNQPYAIMSVFEIIQI